MEKQSKILQKNVRWKLFEFGVFVNTIELKDDKFLIKKLPKKIIFDII